MSRTTRPTGEIPYPCTIIAGGKGTGKTYQIALASASQLVDRTFLLTIGEEEPDAFASLEGQRFEKVEHDGTFLDVLAAIRELKTEPRTDDRPHFLGVDSMTAIYNLLLDSAQMSANRRAQAQALARRQSAPVDNVELKNEDWSAMRRDWNTLLNEIRTWDGPTAMTARLEEQVISVNGVATSERAWRMRADPNFAYEVSDVIEMARRGEYTLTKQNDPDARFAGVRPWPNFTLDALWRDRGLGSRQFVQRKIDYARLDPSLLADGTGRDWVAELAGLTETADIRRLLAQAKAANASPEVIAIITSAAPAAAPQTVTTP